MLQPESANLSAPLFPSTLTLRYIDRPKLSLYPAEAIPKAVRRFDPFSPTNYCSKSLESTTHRGFKTFPFAPQFVWIHKITTIPIPSLEKDANDYPLKPVLQQKGTETPSPRIMFVLVYQPHRDRATQAHPPTPFPAPGSPCGAQITYCEPVRTATLPVGMSCRALTTAISSAVLFVRLWFSARQADRNARHTVRIVPGQTANSILYFRGSTPQLPHRIVMSATGVAAFGIQLLPQKCTFLSSPKKFESSSLFNGGPTQ